MLQWQKSEKRLNELARLLLRGNPLTFHLHYWGAVKNLSSNPVHKHSFYEICYVNSGTAVYAEGETSYPMHEGVLFCSKPGVIHQIRDVEELDLLFVAFEPDDRLSEAKALSHYRNTMDQGAVWLENQGNSPTVHLWKSLLVPESAAGALSPELLPVLAHCLLLSFSDALGPGSERTKTHSSIVTDASILVQRAKRYMRDNLAGDLSLPEIARHLSISERHLSRIFAENIQESFTSVIRSERIRAAEDLLLHTMMPIKDIASQVGFSSVHYFTRLFAENKGAPPARYREANQRRIDE